MTSFDNENTFLRHTERGRAEEFHDKYERAVKKVRGELGRTYPLLIGGTQVPTRERFTVRNPAREDEVIGQFASAGKTEVDAAVAAAREAFPAWRATHFEKRAALFERVAEVLRARFFDLCAWMTLENGKNRVEAAADADEAIDFCRFYARELRAHHGYEVTTGEPYPGERTTSVLRPYGVFAVVAPFNFPLAILAGMTTGAVLTGNTAVVKPASTTPGTAHRFLDALREAGIPPGVVNLVTGSGPNAGEPLLQHPDVAGCVFTGSREVGEHIRAVFARKNGPVIAELGGKNAVIVSGKADLAKAAPGVARAAFGFGGQKCSAASRVYVVKKVHAAFLGKLVEETRKVVIGAPERKDVALGPVIEKRKVQEYEAAVDKARRAGAKVLAGGEVLKSGDHAKGFFVAPTIIDGLPKDHELFRTELFLPILCVAQVDSFEDALREANAGDYGLTAGLYSEDESEVRAFLDGIAAGVVYVNRARSACTGALVHGQPFVGWKWSGTTGKAAGGAYYLPQFLREQSQTVVR